MNRSLVTRLGIVALVQLALVGVAVAPRLSAYLSGDEYRLEIAALDPIDPFRGAYVTLGYPGLTPDRSGEEIDVDVEDPPPGHLFVPLRKDGDLWVADRYVTDRPDHAPYLSCESDGWRVRCGIESWFTGQAEAARLGEQLADGSGVATVRIDGRGHAVLVDVDAG
ncbi:MAG TPA: GDYXXLXY domain-containing protein [Nocardioides sp.]|nr:GDYXXLXY domain-containing protein [Nocardioides sp.]